MKYIIWLCITFIVFSWGVALEGILGHGEQIPMVFQVIGLIGITITPYVIGGLIFILFVKWLIKEIKKP